MMDRKEQGFGMLETLVLFCILGVGLAVMLPGYLLYTDHQRLKATTQELAMSLQFARAEAMRARAVISVCGVAEAAGCHAVSGWEQGWHIPAHGQFWQPEQGIVVAPNRDGQVMFTALGGLAAGSVSHLDVVGARSARCVRISYIGGVRIHQGGC